MAIHFMQQKMPDGDLKGPQQTIFILDEFYSLGHLSVIAKTMGGMPGFGLHLWPFLQDYNQLLELYGREGAGTFIANSEVLYFFGVDDPTTAQFVSDGAGLVNEADLAVAPPDKPKVIEPERYAREKGPWDWLTGRPLNSEWAKYHDIYLYDMNAIDEPLFFKNRTEARQAKAYEEVHAQNRDAAYQDQLNAYAHARNCVGHSRITPEDVMRITRRNPQRGVSDHALVLHDGFCSLTPLEPYFETWPTLAKAAPQALPTPSQPRSDNVSDWSKEQQKRFAWKLLRSAIAKKAKEAPPPPRAANVIDFDSAKREET